MRSRDSLFLCMSTIRAKSFQGQSVSAGLTRREEVCASYTALPEKEQNKWQDIKREIISKIRSQRAVPEDQNPAAQDNKHKLVHHSYCHQHYCAVRDPVPVFVHIVKLDRLAARCRRCDPRIKESDKRILKAAEKAVFLLSHGI